MEDNYYVKALLAQQRIHSVSAVLAVLLLLITGLVLLLRVAESGKQPEKRIVEDRRKRRVKESAGSLLLVLLLALGNAQNVAADLPKTSEDTELLLPAVLSVASGTAGSEENSFYSPVGVLVRWRTGDEGILKIEYTAEQFAEVLELDLGFGSSVTEQMQILDVPWIRLTEENCTGEDSNEKELHFLAGEEGSYSFRVLDQVFSFTIMSEEKKEAEETGEDSEEKENPVTQEKPADKEKEHEEAMKDDSGNKEEPVKEEVDRKAPEVSMDVGLFTDAYGRQMTTVRTIKLRVSDEHFDFSCQPEVLTDQKDSWTFSGWRATSDGAEGTISLKKDGEYTVNFQAQDLAGNRSKQISSGAFFLDKTNPVITIEGVENRGAYADPVTPTIYIEDRSFDLSQVTCSLRGARSGEVKTEQFVDMVRTEKGVAIALNRFSEMTDDVYTLSVQAADQAGNASREEIVFAMDQNGSSYMLSDATKKLMEAYYISEPIDLVLSEINTSPVVYEVTMSKDGEPVLLEEGKDYTVETRGGDGDWMIYVYRIFAANFQEEGVYHVDITSRDQAENVNNTQMRGTRIDFAVDRTPPVLVVENLEDGSWYKEKEHTFVIRTTDKTQLAALKVLVNGKLALEQKELAERETFTLKEAEEEQVVQIIATDKAGNQVLSETYTVMVQRDAKRVPKEVKERAEKKGNRQKGEKEDEKDKAEESDLTAGEDAAAEHGISLPAILLGLLPVLVVSVILLVPDFRRKIRKK